MDSTTWDRELLLQKGDKLLGHDGGPAQIHVGRMGTAGTKTGSVSAVRNHGWDEGRLHAGKSRLGMAEHPHLSSKSLVMKPSSMGIDAGICNTGYTHTTQDNPV